MKIKIKTKNYNIILSPEEIEDLAAFFKAEGASQRRISTVISQAAYEVGNEVREAFVNSDPDAAVCFAENKSGRWQADLYGLAKRSLQDAGLKAIYGGDFCTYTESDRFFSYRRTNPCGRIATLIWLASSKADG